MKPKFSPAVGLAACLFQVRADSREVQLLPAGAFHAIDGRPGDVPGKHWQLDAAAAQRVIAAAQARQNPFVIDYEHQTLNAEKNGQPAPAAGWWDAAKMEWRDGVGLFATDVQWTDQARAKIAANEYKFFSPVFKYDKQTGVVTDILMGALTNYPALDGMEALAARAASMNPSDKSSQETETMKELLKLLGLKDDATEAEAIAALNAITKSKTDAETAAAALKAAADKPDPAKFVPVETVTALQTQVAALTAQMTEREVNDLVKQALDDGRLLPAMETWARELGKKDMAQLKAYIGAAQPIAALKGTQTGGKGNAPAAAGELSEEQRAVCKAMGLNEEEYKKSAGIKAA